MTCEANPLDFGCFTKRPSDRYKVIFDFASLLSKYIEFGKLYRTGEYLLPRRSTGFAYRVIQDGTSGSKEPIWPAALDYEAVSGSLRMVAQPALYNGIDIITGVTVDVADASDSLAIPALIVDGISWDGPYVEIFVSQGSDITDSLISVQAQTQSGQIITGVALCSVRSKKPSLCLCE